MATETPPATVPLTNLLPAPTMKLLIAIHTILAIPPIPSATRENENSICDEATMTRAPKAVRTNLTTQSTRSTVVKAGTGAKGNHATNLQRKSAQLKLPGQQHRREGGRHMCDTSKRWC